MAVRSGDWKLVRPSLAKTEYADVSKQPLLFDLKDDLAEEHDLAARHPEKVRELQSAWDRWNATLPQPRWPATLKGQPLTFTP
jgi:arylsulfatase A-like enzyme